MVETFFTSVINPILNSYSQLEIIQYLRQKNVLKQETKCVSCSVAMIQVKKNDSVDGYAFRCFNKTCTRYRTHKSIRCESFLDDFNIDLKKFIYFVYLYSKEESCETITETIGISSSMLYRMISKLRSKITSYFLNNPIILGGPSVLVQIDESKFNFNVKSHRGHAPRAPIWVFGIVDTSFSPARGFMKVVERRDKRTLMSIITSHVRPGTIIHSD